MNTQLRAGFGRADITPEQYSMLAGFGTDGNRVCNYIMDRIFATCIAITDAQDQTILLITTDLLQSEQISVIRYGREAITSATGVPGNRIMIAATHTHSGPSMYTVDDLRQRPYILFLAKQLAKAASDAMADRKPAQLYIGSKQVPNMTFVRHYEANDGSFAGTLFGTLRSGAKRHLWPADEQLQMIRFAREDARDIVMVNWQSHCTFVGHPEEYVLSGDYVSPLRNHFEGLTGCHFAFFQGACGNLIPTSKVPGLSRVDQKDHMGYGRILAEEAADCLQNCLQPAQGGIIGSRLMNYRGQVDHTEDNLAEEARFIRVEYWRLTDPQERNKLIENSSFNSVHHACQVDDRSRLPETIEIEIDALCAGDIAFATAPYEMFCSNGQFIKNNSPFRQTFVMGYCNGRFAYMPDEAAFAMNWYEVNARRFAKGASEDIVANHVRMLKEIHAETKGE